MSQLDELKAMTTIVADTGDIDAIKRLAPTGATTNPSLILKAAAMPQYQYLIDDALNYVKKKATPHDHKLSVLMDKIFVNFGTEILKSIPGRISTELDARLSFDTEACIERAHSIIKMYDEVGIDPHRILIKIASTYEGAQAAKQLEQEGIHCNMTLMFSLPQAIACADAKATLISPFVGRIMDWYKNKTGSEYEAKNDPGVLSVKEIYNYYKKFDYQTEIMGASFRNKGEIVELAGCDLLTISPKFLDELAASDEPLEQKLSIDHAKNSDIEKIQMDEKLFRWMLNEDAMATEKLSEGIRNFTIDTIKLEEIVSKKL